MTLFLLLVQALFGAPQGASVTVDHNVFSPPGCDVLNRAEFRMHVWMNKLALSDWQIALQVVDAASLPHGEMAHSHMVIATRFAEVSIPDRANYALPCDLQVDMAEAALVHELVHIRLATAFGPLRTEQSKYEEERAVVALTVALLEARK
jgi:hypothetical protein